MNKKTKSQMKNKNVNNKNTAIKIYSNQLEKQIKIQGSISNYSKKFEQKKEIEKKKNRVININKQNDGSQKNNQNRNLSAKTRKPPSYHNKNMEMSSNKGFNILDIIVNEKNFKNIENNFLQKKIRKSVKSSKNIKKDKKISPNLNNYYTQNAKKDINKKLQNNADKNNNKFNKNKKDIKKELRDDKNNIKEQNIEKEKKEKQFSNNINDLENQQKPNEEFESKNQINFYIEKIRNLEEIIEKMKKDKENNNLLEKHIKSKSCDIKKNEKQFEIIKGENEKLKLENKNLMSDNEKLRKQLDTLQDYKKLYEQGLKKNPLIKYKAPTLVGLNNIGATCFMNATLQCLSQTKYLTIYFLNENNISSIINNNIALKNKKENQLSPIYLELIQNLWSQDGQKAFSPNNFMNKINDMNSLFKKGQPGDSKDFIIYILEQFHKELKKPIKNASYSKIEEELNQYDKTNALNHFFNDFQQECSVISDVFFGIIETNNECLYCKQNYNSKGMDNPICYNYQIFNCLIFPLAEVQNMKNNGLNNSSYYTTKNNSCVTLDDCFSYYTRPVLFNGSNQNFCNICKQLNDSYYTTKIFSSPNVLLIILNRGKDNIYNIKLDFEEMIDITHYVLQKDSALIIYELYGVITHIGESGPNAHFIASCKSPIDKKWYRYNDAFVDPITNIQSEIIDYGIPYILFYQKI